MSSSTGPASSSSSESGITAMKVVTKASNPFAFAFPKPERAITGFTRAHPNLEVSSDIVPDVMRTIVVRPRMLEENLRANNFPDEIKNIIVSFKSRLADLTLDQLAGLEDTNRVSNPRCTKSVVTKITNGDASGSIIPWGLLQRDATLIGVENWNVARINQFTSSTSTSSSTSSSTPALPGQIDAESYRVNYFVASDGDFYYSDVVPGPKASLSTWANFARFRASQWWKKLNPKEQAVNDVVLPQPPSRNPPPPPPAAAGGEGAGAGK